RYRQTQKWKTEPMAYIAHTVSMQILRQLLDSAQKFNDTNAKTCLVVLRIEFQFSKQSSFSLSKLSVSKILIKESNASLLTLSNTHPILVRIRQVLASFTCNAALCCIGALFLRKSTALLCLPNMRIIFGRAGLLPIHF